MSKSFTLLEVILILLILILMLEITYSIIKIDYDLNIKFDNGGEFY